MPNLYSIETTVLTYHHQVQKLGSAYDWSDQAAILSLLQVRDRIQFFIDGQAQQPNQVNIPASVILRISKDDAIVREWNIKFSEVENLALWRKTINPPKHHWWWFPKPLSPRPSRTNKLLLLFSISLAIASITLIHDFFTRVLANASNISKSYVDVVTTLFTVIITGGLFTDSWNQLIKTRSAESTTSLTRASRGVFRLSAISCIVIAIIYYVGISIMANNYYRSGLEKYVYDGNLTGAQASFQKALEIKSDFPRAHHYLGLIYEDFDEFEQAKSEYTKSINAGLLMSVNNLARLKILKDKDYNSATILLIKSLQAHQRDRNNKALEYGLRKNLGWAFLEQDRILEAQSQFLAANTIEDKFDLTRPDAYCLLARTFEKQEETTAAQKAWEDCRKRIARPEDDYWAAIADKALKAIENSMTQDKLEKK